jgi:hypothetical protein
LLGLLVVAVEGLISRETFHHSSGEQNLLEPQPLARERAGCLQVVTIRRGKESGANKTSK